MVLTTTPDCHFGTPAIDFSLPNIDGKYLKYADCKGEHGTLVMFICNHCPYVKAIRGRLIEDTLTLAAKGIKSVAIMANDPADYPEDSPENMQKIAEQFNYPFPYLFDESQDIARAYGAVCTPDFFGYNKRDELVYRGRLDAAGIKPASPDTKRELVDAMIEVVETGKGPTMQYPSVGCSIKWKYQAE